MNKPVCYALAFMWAQGAIASAMPSGFAQGLALLTQAGIAAAWAPSVVWGGVMADAFMAVFALLCVKFAALRWHYAWGNVGLIGLYTVLGSVIAPQLWLDPFGALAKNVPIVLWCVYSGFQAKER